MQLELVGDGGAPSRAPWFFRRGTLAGAMLAIAMAGIATADTVTLQSPNPEVGGFFGAEVAGIPDVDGDGLADVIIGAPSEDGGGVNDAGRVYIFSGATGLLIRAHSSPNDTNGGNYGDSVSGVPDLNGDGRGDYIVGAPDEAGPGGRVYVYSGATGNLIRTHVSPNAQVGGDFGYAVAGVQDLSGDGRGDYVIGAPQEDNGGTSNAGRVYVYSGNTGNLIRQQNSPNAESFGEFGWAVAGVPDSTGDGRGDYIVGAPSEDPGGSPFENGRAYIFNGSNGNLVDTLVSGNPESGGKFGFSVAGIPDVGGNGLGDVIVGAPYEDVPVPNDRSGADYFNAGRAYVFSGTTGNLAHTFTEPADELSDEDFFGDAVGGLPDANGDGLGDVIIGSPGLSYRAYVFAADTETLLAELSSPDDTGVNQSWGTAVAGLPDVNGDGRGDYIVGGPGSDDFPSDPSQNGRAYLYRPLANNGCSSLVTLPVLTIGDNEFTTIGATEGSPEAGCSQFADPGPDVWFKYNSNCAGTLSLSTCGQADFNTKLAVYKGCNFVGFFICDLTDLVGCADNTFFCGDGTTILQVPVEQNECYFVRVGGGNNESGRGTITLSCDNCATGETVLFYTDLAAWNAAANTTAIFNTTAFNVGLANEVGPIPVNNTNVGPVLTFDSVSSFSFDFRLSTLQTDASFTFNDTETTVDPPPGFSNALSVGDVGNFEDDDWQIEFIGGDTVYGFGVDLNDNTIDPGESITVFCRGNGILGQTFTVPGNVVNGFFGVVSTAPIARVVFNENPGFDDIAIANFRFASTPACVGDIDGDNSVGPADLALLLGAWGIAGGPTDLNEDGVTGAPDLALLLGAWGPC
ncbi:MAG: hypothetical protein SGJ09_16285 [Phycisphaerae bacterium]|nr:hypothetical protein [Phycisphaerae bacterium]